MTKIVAVDFRGAEIIGVELEGSFYVVLKPVAEALGLAWNGQLEKIKRDKVLSEGMRVIRIPFLRGGNQDAVALRLDRLHGWLFKIDTSRVRDEIRELVQDYQRECYDVLYRHFYRDRDKLLRDENEATSLNLRLVTESRHTHGVRSAAQLWDKLGLPKVPAMDEALRQGDLFDQERQAA